MHKPSFSKSSKCLPKIPTIVLAIALIVFLVFIVSTILHSHGNSVNSHFPVVLPYSLQHQISHLQTQLGILLQQLHAQTSQSKELSNFSDQLLHIATSLDKLADTLSVFYTKSAKDEDDISNVDQDLTEPEETEQEEGISFNGNAFKSPELRNYILPKPNRLVSGKKNFLDLEAINPSIGLGCTHMAANLDRYMTYKVNGICPDDWDLAQKLLIGGCNPLPRRRCFSRTPPHYGKLIPLNSSLWSPPSNANVLWNRYKCKNYECLVSKETVNKRGFYKCGDCFDLSKKGWGVQVNSSVSPEFSIDEVLRLISSEEIRIGLDFSPTTGTFSALMRERNIFIASATLNLGAPFSEVIASRGLLPLYISIGSRLPFFDNTLDIIHSTLFLDGWISLELLDYVLFDWDRVLRPKGILWVDRFFCKKEDMELYLNVFEKLGYKKLLWRVVPKKDKLDDEVFFSAVLEKPIRA